jgi:hypothetical protein
MKKNSAGFVRQKRRKKVPSKFYLLLNKKLNHLPPSMFNEPGTGFLLGEWLIGLFFNEYFK